MLGAFRTLSLRGCFVKSKTLMQSTSGMFANHPQQAPENVFRADVGSDT